MADTDNNDRRHNRDWVMFGVGYIIGVVSGIGVAHVLKGGNEKNKNNGGGGGYVMTIRETKDGYIIVKERT